MKIHSLILSLEHKESRDDQFNYPPVGDMSGKHIFIHLTFPKISTCLEKIYRADYTLFIKKRFLFNLKPGEMLQNLLCLWKKKTHVVFSVFHLEQLSFSPYECPGLCRHRPGHL